MCDILALGRRLVAQVHAGQLTEAEALVEINRARVEIMGWFPLSSFHVAGAAPQGETDQ